MNSVPSSLAEVPTSVQKTPSIKSRVPLLSQTPRSSSKIPLNTQSRISSKFTPKTPSLNTPTSRFLSTANSSRSMSSSINRSTNQLPKTPIYRPPTTPSSNRLSSARIGTTTNPPKSSLPKTPSTFKSSFVSRFPNNSNKNTNSNFYTPIRNKPSFADQKKLSRTVDCAKSIKRRSIKILNQTAGRLSFLNEMDSGCVLMTPKLFQHLINNDKIEEEVEKLNAEDLKVRTIDPNNLLKYLLKKDKNENDSKSIKLEIVVNVNSPSQSGTQPLKLNIDTEKIESALNDQVKSEIKILSDKNQAEETDNEIEQNDQPIQTRETKNSIDDSKLAFVPVQIYQSLDSLKNENLSKENNEKIEQVQEQAPEPTLESFSLCQASSLALIDDDKLTTQNNQTEDDIQKETKNVDFTIPFEAVDDEEKESKNEDKKEEDNVEDNDILECKEISLQTDFNDSIKNEDENEEEQKSEDKNETDKIEDEKIEETKQVSRSKRGRKPKKVCQDCENNENVLTNEKKSRKTKDVTKETSQDKRTSGQRVLTRAQRAKLAIKN